MYSHLPLAHSVISAIVILGISILVVALVSYAILGYQAYRERKEQKRTDAMNRDEFVRDMKARMEALETKTKSLAAGQENHTLLSAGRRVLPWRTHSTLRRASMSRGLS
jgi:hypothetical protein